MSPCDEKPTLIDAGLVSCKFVIGPNSRPVAFSKC